MRHMSSLLKFLVLLLFLALAFGQATPVFSQSDDGIVPDDGAAEPAAAQPDAPAVEKGELAPGEPSSAEGDLRLFLPFAAGGADVQAAGTVTPTWQLVFIDHMCSYPSGWYSYDYNGTSHAWVYAMVDNVCTATVNGTAHKMNVTTWRPFSLAGALAARATFRFKMNTETYYDYLRVEYSCNGGKTYWASPSAYSGAYAWSLATVSLDNCKGASNVRLRFTFQTDKNVVSALAPIIDYVKVEKFQ